MKVIVFNFYITTLFTFHPLPPHHFVFRTQNTNTSFFQLNHYVKRHYDMLTFTAPSFKTQYINHLLRILA